MNLDDLMAVWRSQDVSPLYGVDKTLLLLALRQEQARQRRNKWIIYLISGAQVVLMSFFLAILIYPYDDDVLTGWDYVIPVIGLAAALFWTGAYHLGFRKLARRERTFGESLRDQLARHVEQLDDATKAVRSWWMLVFHVPPFLCALAILFAGWKINDKPFSEDTPVLVGSILMAALTMVVSNWWQRRSVRREMLPRKLRLEAMLKELDDR